MTQTAAMAEKELTKIYNQLKANHAARASGTSLPPKEVLKLANDGQLRVARLGGMNVTALPPHLLTQARLIYEQGALAALELGDSYKFKGFVEKVKPIYEWQMGLKEDVGDMNKIMALYLLYLLTKQEYSEFHIQLEWLHTWKIDYEADRFLAYPIKMEQWIHLGGQDIVWKAMKEGQVPSKEFNAFTPFFKSLVRSESAESSELAYEEPISIASAKALLFLESEGAVVDFARARGWLVKDGFVYPSPPKQGDDGPKADYRGVLENMLHYVLQLETIV